MRDTQLKNKGIRRLFPHNASTVYTCVCIATALVGVADIIRYAVFMRFWPITTVGLIHGIMFLVSLIAAQACIPFLLLINVVVGSVCGFIMTHPETTIFNGDMYIQAGIALFGCVIACILHVTMHSGISWHRVKNGSLCMLTVFDKGDGMKMREALRLGVPLSEIGLGTWQLGSDWGDVNPSEATAILDAAYADGISFYDTADVYGDGCSEQFVGQFRTAHLDKNIFVATKMGRRGPQVFDEYTQEHFLEWNDRSRANLGMDTLDLVQLHCPPTDVIAAQRTYDYLDKMVDEKRIAHYGVSVETCEQALMAMERDNVASIQIIMNIFRQRPLEEVLPRALETGTAIIVRVPLASGLLSGKYTKETTFAPNDHRTYNRHGESFDVGETFAGVPFEVGVEVAQEFSQLVREYDSDSTPSRIALRWILDQEGVTTVIPGGRNVEQVHSNARASQLAPLPQDFAHELKNLYDSRIRQYVHERW